MELFLDVISPKPKFVLIDNNKIEESLDILDKDNINVSDSIHNKFLRLQKNNNFIDYLDTLIVTIGPGSYTSLRVGISFMLGISYAKKISIYGLSALNLMSYSILKKDFNKTIIITCSGKNQNFISTPSHKNNYEYKTYKINAGYKFNNINLNMYSKCMINYPLDTILKKKISDNIQNIKYKKLEDIIIQYLPVCLKKKGNIHPIYISENVLFNN